MRDNRMGNKKHEPRSELMPIRFSRNERAAVERVAAAEHEYPSSYMRRLVIKQVFGDGRNLDALKNQKRTA